MARNVGGTNVVVRIQWRIQDLQEEAATPGGVNLLFGQLFSKNCMKMNMFRPREGGMHPLNPS